MLLPFHDDRTGKSDAFKLSFWERSFCALAGGTCSALSTIPIDVLVAQVQQASQAGKKVRIAELWANARAQGGLAGVVRFSSRGFFARVAHVALTTLMMKTCASAIYDWAVQRRDRDDD